jgi:hypothetical protein
MPRDNEPETCTVELTTGSFVHLACKPSAVLGLRLLYEQRVAAAREDNMVEPPSPIDLFERVTGPGVTGWRSIWIDVTQIVAVYPINARPEAPMVYSVLAAGGYVPPGV